MSQPVLFGSSLLKIAPLFICLLLLSSGCTYFKYMTVATNYDTNLNHFVTSKSHFVIHQNDMRFSMKVIMMDSVALYGMLDTPSVEIFYYSGRTDRIKAGERKITQEVHCYLNSSATLLETGRVVIPYENIGEIRIMEKNKNKSARPYGVVVIVSILIFAGLSQAF